MTDIVERLRSRREPTIEVDMHYPQIVDSDEPDVECAEAADLITALRAENDKLSVALRAWDDAVKIHVTMEGPHYAGMSSELAKKAWGKTRAALGDTHE